MLPQLQLGLLILAPCMVVVVMQIPIGVLLHNQGAQKQMSILKKTSKPTQLKGLMAKAQTDNLKIQRNRKWP